MAEEKKTPQSVTYRRATRAKATLEIHRLGPHPLVGHFIERLDLVRILDKHIYSNRGGAISHGAAIAVLVHNVLVSRDPLYRLPEWIEQIDAHALGLTPEQKQAVNDDRMARALDQFAEYGGRGVFFQLALRAIKLFNLETSRIHFDTTSVSFTGSAYSGTATEPEIRRGFNKDHRPDLRQLVFGLNVTADGAVPLAHEIYSGNQTDDTLHRSNLDGLRDLLAKDDFIYVADSKLCTKENLKHIADFGGKFVTLLPRTRKEDATFRQALRKKAGRWRQILSVEPGRHSSELETYYVYSHGAAATDDGFRIIWIKSSSKARRDEEHRTARLAEAEAALKDLQGRLNERKLKTRRQIKTACKAILKAHQCEDFVKVSLIPKVITTYRQARPGRPKAGDPKRRLSETQYELKIEPNVSRRRQERNVDGVFPLVTNLPATSSALDVLQIYRYQPYLERRFENLKTEYSVAPVYLKTPKRIVGFLNVCFLALMVAALIERELRRQMTAAQIESLPIYPEERECRAPTTPRILELFGQIDWFRHVSGEESIEYPVQLTALQTQILKLLGTSDAIYNSSLAG